MHTSRARKHTSVLDKGNLHSGWDKAETVGQAHTAVILHPGIALTGKQGHENGVQAGNGTICYVG